MNETPEAPVKRGKQAAPAEREPAAMDAPPSDREGGGRYMTPEEISRMVEDATQRGIDRAISEMDEKIRQSLERRDDNEEDAKPVRFVRREEVREFLRLRLPKTWIFAITRDPSSSIQMPSNHAIKVFGRERVEANGGVATVKPGMSFKLSTPYPGRVGRDLHEYAIGFYDAAMHTAISLCDSDAGDFNLSPELQPQLPWVLPAAGAPERPSLFREGFYTLKEFSEAFARHHRNGLLRSTRILDGLGMPTLLIGPDFQHFIRTIYQRIWNEEDAKLRGSELIRAGAGSLDIPRGVGIDSLIYSGSGAL